MEKSLTSGSVMKNIFYFALPYFLSYFLQTLYGMADLYVVGRFNGVDGITAVTNGSQVMYMITVIIVGLAMGTTVIVGRAVGAGRQKEGAKAIGNTVTLFMVVSLVLMGILLLLAGPIVKIIGTPKEAIQGTREYLTVCFIGIPFITAYNIISSIFRGIGDSKSPMYFIGVACVLNVALDFLFIGGFHMGPIGAALGTTLSQTFSVLVAIWAILKKDMGISLKKEDFRPNKEMMAQILKIGVPVAVQDGCIQVAFIIITVIANHRGLNDAAAVGVVEKIISAVFIVPSSMLATVSALAAQNMGAGKHDRAAKILRYAIYLTTIYGIFITIVVLLTSQNVVGIFTKDKAVILLGSQYIRGYIWDTIVAGIHFSFSGFFCAYGKSYIGFLHNILAIILVRVPGSYLASLLFANTLLPMGLAAPGGSLLSVLICLVAYGWLKSHNKLIPAA